MPATSVTPGSPIIVSDVAGIDRHNTVSHVFYFPAPVLLFFFFNQIHNFPFSQISSLENILISMLKRQAMQKLERNRVVLVNERIVVGQTETVRRDK